MPSPSPHAIDYASSDNMTCDSQREIGPYSYSGALYVFAFVDDTFGASGEVKIACFRSTDDGVTWTAQDDSASPDAWTGNTSGQALATYQYGSNVIAAYSADGGTTIAGSANPKLAFAIFSMSSNTWGSPVLTGPTIYRPGNFPSAPVSGYGSYIGGLTVGNTIDWGQISVVVRSSGEFVFLFDSHDMEHEDTAGGFGYYYRRCSIVRYSGSWSSAYVFYNDPDFHRDYYPGNLVLDADGSTVHVFLGSAGQPDEGAAHLPWLGVMRNNHVVYSNYDASNSGLSPELLTMDADYHFGWHVIAPAAQADDGVLHVLYRKSDATLAVMSGSSGSWTESTIAAIDENSDNSLCAGLAIFDGELYALYWNGVYTTGRSLYYSQLAGGSWTDTFIYTGAANFSIEMSSTHGFAEGIAFVAIMGDDPYPYAVIVQPLAAVGGSARNRYRAA